MKFFQRFEGKGDQQCPLEFFQHWIDALEPRTGDLGACVRVGLLGQRKCHASKHETFIRSSERELILPLRGTLQSSMKTYFEPENIELKCEQCTEKIQELHRLIDRLPSSLVLMLQRLVNRPFKDEARCIIPKFIDVRGFCSKAKKLFCLPVQVLFFF